MGSEADVARVLEVLGPWSAGGGPLHAQLQAALARAVRRGELAPGTRLPAERRLAAALAVSRGTVVTAFAGLRDAGWLASQQGSGTWVRTDAPRPLQVATDPVGVAGRSRRLSGRLLQSDPQVVDLAISAVLDMDPVPEHLLAPPGKDELLVSGGRHGYLPFGSPQLRAAIAARYSGTGLPTTPDQVLVTSGAQQALALAAAATLRPGDAAVVESPTYPGAIDVLARAGARLVPVPPAASWPSAAVLRDAVRSSGARLVYLMPACHNPLGTVLPEARRREVAAVADELGTWLLADDLLELLADVRQPPPLASFSRTSRVLTVSSLSKVVWGGLRVGWLRAPVELVAQLGRTRAAADYGMSAVSSALAVRLLEPLDEIAAARRQQARERREVMADLLARSLPEWSVSPAEGGLSLWVRLPVGDADTLEQHAARAGVSFTPGGAHSVDDSTLGHLRLSCTQPPDVLVEGVRRLDLAWRSYLRAVDRRLSAG